MQPHWQEEWRMCLHKRIIFTSPFLSGRGPGGWSEHPAPTQGIQRSAALWEGSEGVPPRMQAGSPEGCNPTGRRNGGCASINASSLLPPSFQEGGQGDGVSDLLTTNQQPTTVLTCQTAWPPPLFRRRQFYILWRPPVQPADPVKPSDIGIAFIGLLPILFILLMLTVVIPGFMG